ncbi:MAG TPA: hypothetical protein VF409_07775 [Sphingomonas sp.]
MSNPHGSQSDGPTGGVQDSGIGCVIALIALNALVMGFLVLGFAFGSYSSFGQEVWYRYGSLGFLICGAILPAAVLVLRARRSPGMMLLMISWLFFTLVACVAYAMMSGGGV